MSDYIVRATAANSQIRAFAAVTTDMVETARKNHNTSPVATAALGRLPYRRCHDGSYDERGKGSPYTSDPCRRTTAGNHSNCRFSRKCKGLCGGIRMYVSRQTAKASWMLRGSCRRRLYGCDQGYGTGKSHMWDRLLFRPARSQKISPIILQPVSRFRLR